MRFLKIIAGVLAAVMFMLSAVSGLSFADGTIITSGETSSDETSDTTTSSYVSDVPVSSDIPVSSDTSEPDYNPIIDEETGLMFTLLEDGTYAVGVNSAEEGDMLDLKGDVVVPAEFNGKQVTRFLGLIGCDEITSVEISEGITEMYFGAFGGCSNLKEISIPSSLKIVINDDFYFWGCNSLINVNVSEDNENFCSVDGVVFTKDKSILMLYPAGKTEEHYTIPDFVTTLSRDAFCDCNNLISVTIPENVSCISDYAFDGCENLKTVNISSGVCDIETHSFDYCHSLQMINVNDNNLNYCSDEGVLFSKDMTQLLKYPDGKPDETYTVPHGVVDVDGIKNGFIKYLNVPEGVKVIVGENYSVIGDSVEVITLPKSLEKFSSAITNFEHAEIRYGGTMAEWYTLDDYDYHHDADYSSFTIICSDGVIEGRNPHIVTKAPAAEENDNGLVIFMAGITQEVADTVNGLLLEEIGEIKNVINNISVDASVEAEFDTSIKLYVNPNVRVPSDMFKTSMAFDLTFENADGDKVQPQKPVTVKIPVPERFKDSSTICVYHIGDDNNAEKIEAEVRTFDEVEYVVFEASKFSTYVLTDVEVQGYSDTSGTTSGDTSSSTSSGTSTPTTSIPTTSEPTSSGTSDPNTSKPTTDNNTSSGSTSNPTSSDNTSSTSTPANGDVSQGVTSGNNVPKAEIKTPNGSLADAVLTAAELKQYKKGADLGVALEVRSAESSVSYSDKMLVEKALSKFGYKLGRYLDLQLFKTLDKGNKTQVKQTNSPITVSFEIPEVLRASGREYVMIRVHNGEVDVLKDYDDNANTIIIRTDKFSVYALVYSEISASVDNSQNGANNPYTGNNSPTTIYFTVGIVSLIVFVILCLFTGKNGMSEEEKERRFSKIIAWGKRGGKVRAVIALAVIFLLLSFYYGIGMKTSEN